MKPILVAIGLFAFALQGIAQDCTPDYFPSDAVNGQFPMSHFSKSDKLLATTKHNFSASNAVPNQEVAVDWSTENERKQFSSSYAISCNPPFFEANVFAWFYDPLLLNFTDYQIDFDGGTMPMSNLSEGSVLPEAQMVVNIYKTNYPLSQIVYKTSEGIVLEKDTLEIDGKQIICWEINYNLTTIVGDDPKYNSIVYCKGWLAEGMGVVRLETYSIKNKLIRYSEMR